MTPFAQKLFRNSMHLIGSPAGDFTTMLANSLCFEISNVVSLISETSNAMSDNPVAIDGGIFYDHGGLLFMPAPLVWLEFSVPGRKIGLLLNEVDEEIGVFMVAQGNEKGRGFVSRREGELFSVHTYAQKDAEQFDNELNNKSAAVTAAIALMLINAPSGVLRKPQPVHKGLVRDARRYGIGQLRPAHKIVLDINAGDIGGASGTGPSSEKAFHYCRSHIRRITPDRSIVVRGHWKGNPALGIARGDYVVRGDRAGTIH